MLIYTGSGNDISARALNANLCWKNKLFAELLACYTENYPKNYLRFVPGETTLQEPKEHSTTVVSAKTAAAQS